MSAAAAVDFDFVALFAALDEQRRARGLSWQQVGRDLRPEVSASTVLRTARGGPMEADGVLSMIRWLGSRFAAFTTGLDAADAERDLADTHTEAIRRFETRAVVAALDERRRARGLTWQDIAAEIGRVDAGALASLGRRSRMRVPEVVYIAAWLGRPVEDFTRAADR